MLKASENPPSIWPADRSISEFAGTWWVAHTKSRNEKALAWDLQQRTVSYFLPMHWKVSRKGRRTFRSLLPLFTGYMFFCGTEEDRVEVLRTNRVANIIVVKDQDLLVKNLLPIERLISEGADLKPHKYIEAGRKCRVVAGPLLGTEGIVEESSKHTRLVLQVEMLGQATSVEIETDYIELVD